jgi:hypothetical protein
MSEGSVGSNWNESESPGETWNGSLWNWVMKNLAHELDRKWVALRSIPDPRKRFYLKKAERRPIFVADQTIRA